MLFSRFTHYYYLNDHVCLYHSLRMKPVYIEKSKYDLISKHIDNLKNIELTQNDINQEIHELIKYKILIFSPSEDEYLLKYVRSMLPKPSLSVFYFILTEQCNLACKYCFLGNNNPIKREKFMFERMSKETANKALLFFIRQLEMSENNFLENQPSIIFYGGEPLINFDVLEYIVNRINELKIVHECIQNLELSIITNGVLLDSNKLLKLKELGVMIAISIDGCSENSNSMRVDRYGNLSFKHVLQTLDIARQLSIDISLSITLTEETIKNKYDVINLIKKYDIKNLGFNILMSDDSFSPSDEYNEKAAQFIIDTFLEFRQLGVYEDRIMRKLKSFSESRIYFSDCAATSGSQIVVAPDGAIGICQACLLSREFFVTSVNDNLFDMRTNPVFIEWAGLSPINKDSCLSCEALGICGGGCPINALKSKPTNSIYSIDDRFCIHAKKTLDFFIRDLYRIILKDM